MPKKQKPGSDVRLVAFLIHDLLFHGRESLSVVALQPKMDTPSRRAGEAGGCPAQQERFRDPHRHAHATYASNIIIAKRRGGGGGEKGDAGTARKSFFGEEGRKYGFRGRLKEGPRQPHVCLRPSRPGFLFFFCCTVDHPPPFSTGGEPFFVHF